MWHRQSLLVTRRTEDMVSVPWRASATFVGVAGL